jgi:hypothetical protein
MRRYILEGWLCLLILDLIMRFRRFRTLHEIVLKHRVRPKISTGGPSSEMLVHAVDSVPSTLRRDDPALAPLWMGGRNGYWSTVVALQISRMGGVRRGGRK